MTLPFVDEFRDPAAVTRLLDQIRRRVTRRWVIMDVCGGQTHAFLKYGLEAALADSVELIHGPGCPVCVTPAETLDQALKLLRDSKVILASFGDMLRVPSSRGSLLQARADGASVRMVYSPLDAVTLAEAEPDRQVIFLAVGFESTAPATALAVLQAQRRGVSNFSVLSHHVRVEPAMRAVLAQPQCRVEGLLAAGHVCTVTGYGQYQSLVDRFQTPIVVTGFEPVDLLQGVARCVNLLEDAQPRLENAYARSVRYEGNLQARGLIGRVFEVASLAWRGFGEIVDGGLTLRSEFQVFDARSRFGLPVESARPTGSTGDDPDCQSAAVLSGRIKPVECPLFGTHCHPDQPRGAPMVSSEGACAAYYRYVPRKVESDV